METRTNTVTLDQAHKLPFWRQRFMWLTICSLHWPLRSITSRRCFASGAGIFAGHFAWSSVHDGGGDGDGSLMLALMIPRPP